MIGNEFVKSKLPNSLRWKWGIILFLIFSIFGLFCLITFRNISYKEQREHIQIDNQYRSDHTIEKFKEILEEDGFAALMDAVKFVERDGTQIRLFNHNDKLIYETSALGISTTDLDEKMVVHESRIGPVFASVHQIPENLPNVGMIQYILQADKLINMEKRLDHSLFWILCIMFLITLLLSFILSRRLLRPLTYMIDTLDIIEEDSLSEIRIQEPKNEDEWNDLGIHINRLLDRMDKYVNGQKQFVEDVSHELRTPVAIVEGHLKLLNRWGKDDPEVLEESINVSLQEISRMKELVQEMLDLSRANHVDVDYKDEITDVYTSTKSTFNNFKMLHPDFSFFLDVNDDVKNTYVQIYKNHYEQILIILLDNAVKYSHERKEIHVSLSQNLGQVEIAVQDFGVGMSEYDKEKVFSRFYRVDKARSREKGGNGLGLSITKQLVEGYKGHIRLESSLNYGTIFYIDFPILKDNRQIYRSKQLQELRKIRDEM